MADYKIITDSSVDLSLEVIQDLELEVVPFTGTIKGDIFNDSPDMSEEDRASFYKKIKIGVSPETPDISVEVFEKLFRGYLEQGKGILYISQSSALSGCYENACKAAESLQGSFEESAIYIVDSLNISAGLGVLAFSAGMFRKEELSIEENYSKLCEMVGQIHTYVIVEDFVQLKKCGYVNADESVGSAAMKIKPVLIINNEGKFEIISRQRGVNNALTYVKEAMEGYSDLDDGIFVVTHCNAPDRAEKFVENVTGSGLFTIFTIGEAGLFTGKSAGNGAIFAAFIAK